MSDLKCLIGDVARPLAILIIAVCCGLGILLPVVGPEKLGLALTALGAMYAAKTMENNVAAKQSASVAIAQSPTPSP